MNSIPSDTIYFLADMEDHEARFKAFVNPLIGQQKQAIVFTPHIETIKKEVELLKQKGINCAGYSSEVDYEIRDGIRDQFENGEIQILYATPLMYFVNREEFFPRFVRKQLSEGNLAYIVFDDAKFLYKYNFDGFGFHSYHDFAKLKDFAPNLHWKVIVDPVCREKLEEISKILRLNEPTINMALPTFSKLKSMESLGTLENLEKVLKCSPLKQPVSRIVSQNVQLENLPKIEEIRN
ncbi:uncharacterized protein LOC134827438 [Culicoides brevitarsis]|uniref:uncharacterized protein LOC134827438 n=1 Tax=Culicoides brevitarsis TaxID=469753 RepID=UPI00307C2968